MLRHRDLQGKIILSLSVAFVAFAFASNKRSNFLLRFMNERVEMKQNFFRLFSFSVRNVNRTIECHNKSVFVTF